MLCKNGGNKSRLRPTACFTRFPRELFFRYMSSLNGGNKYRLITI